MTGQSKKRLKTLMDKFGYSNTYPEKVRGLVSSGYGERQCRSIFQVSQKLWKKWRRDHADFDNAIIQAGIERVGNVAQGLFKRACGFSEEIVTKREVTSPDGDVTKTLETKTKYHPPDVTAMAFFLTNRDNKRWKRVPEPEETESTSRKLEVVFVDSSEKRIKKFRY